MRTFLLTFFKIRCVNALALASSLLSYATDDVLVELLPLRAEQVSTASELMWLHADRAGVAWCQASWYGERAGVAACRASLCGCLSKRAGVAACRASWCGCFPKQKCDFSLILFYNFYI